jgi:hypothetical protein
VQRPEQSTPALADMERAQPGIRSPPQAEIIRLQYKDFIPMGQDPIDQTLAELRQSFADISTMLNIAIALRRNSSHLLTLLRSMMIDLCEQIDRAVPSLPEEEGTRDA